MTPTDFRHLETLAQMSHLDHVLASGPVNYDRCDRRLCRESVRVLAALAASVVELDHVRELLVSEDGVCRVCAGRDGAHLDLCAAAQDD